MERLKREVSQTEFEWLIVARVTESGRKNVKGKNSFFHRAAARAERNETVEYTGEKDRITVGKFEGLRSVE
jgi:hypothetical protein